MRFATRSVNREADGKARLWFWALGAALLAVSSICAITGGIASPWMGLMYLPLVLAGFRSLRLAFLTCAWAVIMVVGMMAVHPVVKTESAVQAFARLASLFAVALLTGWLIEGAELARRRLDEDAADARSALDTQHMISAAYDLEMTLDLVVLKQRELLAADSYAFLLPEGGGLKVSTSSGLPSGVDALRFPVRDEDFGWLSAGGKPQIIADTQSAPTIYQEIDPLARSIILVPLMSVERLVGLLYFGSHSPHAYGATDLDRVEAFSDNVVFAVQRALLEDELKRLAYTDAQTMLFNHRHFQEQLDEEVRRAQRYGRQVSLILMDIDSFKEFNDTYGHPAGDRILRDLAYELKLNLRTVDIAARYGGEEFVVICPETQRDQAIILAERLCMRIAETQFNVNSSGPKQITVSIGVSCFPADASSKAGLVDAADKALYEAKRAGKNRVVAYSP